MILFKAQRRLKLGVNMTRGKPLEIMLGSLKEGAGTGFPAPPSAPEPQGQGTERQHSPEVGARVNNPVAGRLLSDALFHERLLGAEQFHGEFVVGWLEERLQLVL